jgi:DNA polymerase-3 subunit gamma/tau
LTSYGDEITLDQVQMVLGTVAGEAAGQLVACLADGDVAGGLDLINRTVADGADPRQFGREVVEYLRGLLLIHEGAGTRLLNVTAEQAAGMEALAGRLSVGQLLRAIRLFNDAAVELKRGLQTIPQLPLEMALVETIVEPGVSVASGAPAAPAPGKPSAETPASQQGRPRPEPAPPRPQDRRVAEAPAAAPPQASPQAAPGAGGTLSLAQVSQAWEQVLHAVRQRNPTAEGALRSGCEPVEVSGEEIVITFPYPFLRDKLGDPQRKTEIQDALSEVLNARCRLKLVLAAEYRPRQRANPAPAEPEPAEPALDDQALDQLSRWAQERGGHVIQP